MQQGIDRQKLIEEKIGKAEARAVTSLALIRQIVREFLVHEKGYLDEDIEIDREFEIDLDGAKTPASVDYILRPGGKRFMAIKCSPGALESRERHVLAFSRVVDTYQIPLAAVTDGVQARVLDTLTGKLIAEGLDAVPDRSGASEILAARELMPYPAERLEREKRILLAFDTIKCTEESCE